MSLCALSICNAFKNVKKQRDDAREESTKGAYECCDLDNKLRGTVNELHFANDRLRSADNGMDDERKEFRDTIQELNDRHLVDEEQLRSLRQDVSNTECDVEEYGRKFDYALQENQKLEREKQQLEASLAEKDETINDIQAHKNDTIPEPVAAVPTPPIYTQPNDEIETGRPVTTILILRDPAMEQATADEEETDAHRVGAEVQRDAHAKSGEDLEKQVAAKDGELAEKDGRIDDLEQRNGTLATDLENLRDEHGECSGHLARKDDEIRNLQGEKTTADEDSAKTIATLRTQLKEKEQKDEDLEEANGTLAAEANPSEDAVQHPSTLSDELEEPRLAHAECNKKSTSQVSTIRELLEQTLQLKNDDIGSLHGQVTSLRNDLKEVQDTHAKCGEHANTEASGSAELGNANELLQESNNDLLKQLKTARAQHASLVEEGQQVLDQYNALKNLHSVVSYLF